MDFSHYPEEIQKLSEQILETRYTDRALVMEYCDEMIAIGNEKMDPYLLGFAYYYKAEYYFVKNDYHNFVDALLISVEYQQQSSQWMLLTRSYNLLGVNAYTQGNITVALDHYLVALKYCEEHNFDYEKAMVYTNIGHIYLAQKNYIRALEYFSRGREIFVQKEDVPFAKTNIILIDIAMGRAYLALGDLKAAIDREKMAGANEKLVMEDDESTMSIMCFHSQICHYRGDVAESDHYIAMVIDSLDECTSILDIHDDIMSFVKFLLDTDRLEEYILVTQKVDNIIDKMGITKIKMDILRLWIRYYKLVQDRENYLEACARLYEMETVYEEENIDIIRNSTQLRFKLEESKRAEEKLAQEKLAWMKKSETDALTGLPNRFKLNEYAEDIFEQAYHEGKSLGVEMVDIDYFKEYNDTYGHQAGDRALIALADVLKDTAENEGIFCARYGGDEFVVIYYDKTDEQILKITAQIKEKVNQLRIKHEKSEVSEYVTISQGIRNTVPVTGNKIWDYLFSADTALYKMKGSGRNGIYLVHRMKAENVDNIVITDEMSQA